MRQSGVALNEILIRDIAVDRVIELDAPFYYVEASNPVETRVLATEVVAAEQRQAQAQYAVQKTSAGAVLETVVAEGELLITMPDTAAEESRQGTIYDFRVLMRVRESQL